MNMRVNMKHFSSSPLLSYTLLSIHLTASLPIPSSPRSLYLSLLFIYNFSFAPSCLTSTPSHLLQLSISPISIHQSTSHPPSSSLHLLILFSLRFIFSHLCPLVSSLIGYSFTCFFPLLFSHSLQSFFSVYTRPLHTSPHLTHIPFPLPSLLHSWAD